MNVAEPLTQKIYYTHQAVQYMEAIRDYLLKKDQNIDHPISLYAATKKANELMAHSYAIIYDIPSTGLRFFTVYGPWGRPDMAPMIFAKKLSIMSLFQFLIMER